MKNQKENIKNFISEKLKEAEFKVNYAEKLAKALDLDAESFCKLSDEINGNKGFVKACNEIMSFIDTLQDNPLTGGFEDNIPLAFKLYTARVRMGKNQGEMAQIIGCDQSSVCQWESGFYQPRFRKYRDKIEELYEASKKIPNAVDICKSPVYKIKNK